MDVPVTRSELEELSSKLELLRRRFDENSSNNHFLASGIGGSSLNHPTEIESDQSVTGGQRIALNQVQPIDGEGNSSHNYPGFFYRSFHCSFETLQGLPF